MNIYNSRIDATCGELVTTGFTWTDSQGLLHIYLPALKERLEEVGLTIVDLVKDEVE